RAPRAASCRVTLLAPIWRAGQAAPHGLDVAAGRRGTAPPRGGGRAGRVASRRPPRDGVPPRARNEPEPVSDVFYSATGRRSKRAAARFAPRPGPAAQDARRFRARRVRTPARPRHEQRVAPGPDPRPLVRLAAPALGAHRADRRDAG